MNEVVKDGEFVPLQAWFDLYEPKKAASSEKKDSGPNAIERKAQEALVNKVYPLKLLILKNKYSIQIRSKS